MTSSLGKERIKYIIAVVLYGTIGYFLRFVNYPSEFVAMCRGFIGSLFIFLYLKSKGSKIDRAAITMNLKWLLLSGICLGLNWIFLFAAYLKTTVAIASLCNYLAPLIVVLIAPFVLKEKWNKGKMIYVAAAFLGILLVTDLTKESAGSFDGILLGLLAALCFVGIVLCNRKLRDISAYDRALVQLFVSALTILPYVILHNRGSSFALDTRSLGIILMLGLLHTGVAYCLYFSGMANLPVQTVAVLGYLEPVVSVLSSAFLLHEPLTLKGWIGSALVILSAALSELPLTKADKS